MANVAPPVLIEAPTPPPRPPGLFDVALGPLEMPRPEAQGGGVMYVPDTCTDDVFLYAINCPAVSGSKTFSGIETAVSGAPFGVITSYTCGSIGWTIQEIENRIQLRMSLREQRAVERRVWQGFDNSNAQGALTGLFRGATSLGSAGCPTEAVAMLEQALADNGVVGGAIHARPYMSAHLAQSHQTIAGQGRRFFTYRGTPIAFGEGYDGTGPTGQAVTSTVEYMYASGRVVIWGSPIQIPDPRQTMARTTNQMNVIGEKVFVATVECGVWAVAVTRSCATAGTTT
jgi:hypothetical protein